MSQEISIQRALTELKGIDSKIQAKQYGVKVGVIVFPGRLIDGLYTAEQFKTKGKEDIQSVEDLFKKKAELKTAIYISNSTTDVTIDGKQMKVSEAIVKRESAPAEINLYTVLQSQIRQHKSTLQQSLDKQNAVIEKQFEEAIKKGGEGAKTAQETIEQYKKQTNPELVLSMPEAEIAKKLEDLQKFMQDVDIALSESNAVTKINVDNKEEAKAE